MPIETALGVGLGALLATPGLGIHSKRRTLIRQRTFHLKKESTRLRDVMPHATGKSGTVQTAPALDAPFAVPRRMRRNLR
jgi:hypothetical protein